jgi:hypothetical protein
MRPIKNPDKTTEEGTSTMAKEWLHSFPKLLTHRSKYGDRYYINWPAAISGTGKRKREYH